jgi:PBSX family phage portal protein
MLKLIGDGTTKTERPEHKITFIQQVIKGETWLVMAHSAVELEDEFTSLYYTAGQQNNLFLMPPFEPNVLLNLVQTNNVLNQCIEAMEVNIDGTGHEFVPSEEGEDIDKEEEKIAKSFFDEPYPNISMVTIRRRLRRQMESVGYGFLEVLRNLKGDIVGLRTVETAHVRMVKLDAPIQVQKTIERDGKDVELTLWVRERRFAQTVALKQQIYYREYGTTREINRDTGDWETDDKKVPPEKRGTELFCLGINPDVTTPYWLPRWINELPSVVGSRAAEEQNLQFLDAGGLPPAIVFIQGGTLIKDTSDQLRMYLSGMNKNKNRAVVVEVQSSSGSLDAAGKVDVKVERFGSAQSQDSMFTNYDEVTEEHVRVGFRLPPLFLGKAADYNFATAQTAYMVAEAQVFLPERAEFDELINKTIIKELKLKTLKFKSKPITLKDVATQIQALTLAAPMATRESFLKDVNTVSSLNLELAAMPHPNVAPGQTAPGDTIADIPHEQLPAGMAPPVITSPQPEPKEPEPPKEKEETHVILKPGDQMHPIPKKNQTIKVPPKKEKKAASELMALTRDYAVITGLLPNLVQKQEISVERAAEVAEAVKSLTPDDAKSFNSLLAMYVFGSDDADLATIVAASRG